MLEEEEASNVQKHSTPDGSARSLTLAELQRKTPLYLRPTPVVRSTKDATVVSAWYARYSSDEQSQTSIARQFDNCASAEARANSICKYKFSDPECTGMNMNRRGLQDMLRAAAAGAFRRLYIEDVDRLSRLLRNLLWIYEKLASHEVELWDSKHGKLDFVHVVIFGFMAQQGRERMLDNMKGGQRKKIEEGYLPGNPLIGYKNDPYRKRIRMIDDEWSKRVVEAFELVASGATPYAVAKDFNVRYPTRPGTARRNRNLKTPAWTPSTIRNMIRNYIYIGFYIWGKTRQIKDFETGKVMRHVESPADALTIVHVERLALVDPALWARANEKLDERTSPQIGPVRKGLFNRLIVCGCKSGMHESGDGAYRRYLCNSHKSVSANPCTHSDSLPVAAVQRAAIKAFSSNLGTLDGVPVSFRRHVEREARAAREKADFERSEIERRLAAISAEHEDTWQRRHTINRTEEWLAERRLVLNSEEERLRTRLARLNAQGDPKIFFEDLVKVASGIEEMVDALPWRPDTAAGMALGQSFRALLKKVEVSPPINGIARGRLLIRKRWSPHSASENEDAQFSFHFDAPLETDHFIIDFDVNCLRDAAESRTTKREQKLAQLMALGKTDAFRLPDAALRSVRQALRTVRPKSAEGVDDTRRLCSGLLLFLKTDHSLDDLDLAFGAGFTNALRTFRWNGRLDRALDTLAESHPRLLEGANFAKLGISTLKRSPAQLSAERGRQHSDFNEVDGVRLLDEAASELDALVASRKRSVGWALSGVPLKEVADREKLSVAEISRRIATYRADPERGLDRREDLRKARHQLNEEQYTAIKGLIEQGVDPDDPTRKLTWAGIMRFCKRYNLTYSQNYLSHLLRDRGVSLTNSVAAARRGAGAALRDDLADSKRNSRSRIRAPANPRPIAKSTWRASHVVGRTDDLRRTSA